MISSKNRNLLLIASEAFAMLAISIAGLLSISAPAVRIATALLLAVFAAILFTDFFWRGSQRRVHVGLTILTALAAVVLIIHHGWNYFPILFFLLAPSAMILLPAKRGLLWIAIFILVTASISFFYARWMGLVQTLPFASGYVFFGIFGWLTVESEHNRKRSEHLLGELQIAHEQLQTHAERLEELTIAQERNRIAREMHDTLGHRLTIASLQLEGAQRLIPTQPERAASILETVRGQVKEGLGDLRRTVAMLRAPVAEDLPLREALSRLVEQAHQAGTLKIHLALEGCPESLPPDQQHAFYRAAQEGLTNVQRHACANQAWLRIVQQEDQITLILEDDGVGVDAQSVPASSFGLTGLKERAALQGGQCTMSARPGGGTRLKFTLPTQGDSLE